ncbi:hypothetical protein LCGC14_1559850 [marine sediment metagenome]|uniref:Uncharacterized protein n=1 Tax=marine sediment metagenome TaxID=412755 RepID=A0A0F9IMU6_9ZZZZ
MKPEYDFNGKTETPLLIDDTVINWFRHTSDGTPIGINERINEVLRLRMYKEILALDERKLKDG